MAGIYIHIPFCAQACFYCDFHFSTSLKTKHRVVNAIKKDLINQKIYLNKDVVDTIYFGGGTPSLMDDKDIKSIYTIIKKNYILSKNIEFTIEANPEDISINKVQDWINIGVNRVSLGVQSFKSEDLKYMNRIHTKKQVLYAMEVLKKSKINNLSLDLIYGYPLLDNKDWLDNLKELINFDVPHISCYCLTIEKNTPLFSLIEKGVYAKLSSQKGRSQFLIAREFLLKHGYNHYEISNFSKSGFESRHNQNYWNRTPYVGVGPSAHSFNGTSRQWNIKNNIKYCQKIENNELYYAKEVLKRKDTINEHILTRIRTAAGIDIDFLKIKMNKKEWQVFNNEVLKLDKDHVVRNKKKIYLTTNGMLIADDITKKLFLI